MWPNNNDCEAKQMYDKWWTDLFAQSVKLKSQHQACVIQNEQEVWAQPLTCHSWSVVPFTLYYLSAANIWFSANMLQLNVDKTQQNLFTLKHDASEDFEAVRLLGFWLDPQLSWSSMYLEFALSSLE